MTQPNIIVSLKLKDSKRHLGSAVAVAPNKLLTAKHVVMPDGEKISETDIQATLISNREFLSVKHIDHHPDRDISLITLVHEHQKTVVSCNLEPALEENLMVKLLACNTAEKCVKGPYDVQLINWIEPGGWEFHTTPAHGMSGGAVLLDDKLVGIIQVRDNAEGSGIMIPLSEIKEFLLEHLKLDADCQEVTELFQSESTKNKGSKLPPKNDDEFLKQIKENISNELKLPEVSILTQLLEKELYKVHSSLELKNKDGKDIDGIAGALIDVMKNGGEGIPVFNQVLSTATMNCFDRLKGSHFREARENHDAIAKTIEQLVGWLVLASLDYKIVSKILPDSAALPAIYFEIPVETAGGVEAIVSHQYKRAAVFRVETADICGKHMMSEKFGQISWHEDTTISALKLKLWNKVFSDSRVAPPLSETETKKLNSRLHNARNSGLKKEHYYLAIQSDKFCDDDAFKKTYKALLNKNELDNLTIVRFGWGANNEYFITYEQNLMDAIHLFFNNFNEIRAI